MGSSRRRSRIEKQETQKAGYGKEKETKADFPSLRTTGILSGSFLFGKASLCAVIISSVAGLYPSDISNTHRRLVLTPRNDSRICLMSPERAILSQPRTTGLNEGIPNSRLTIIGFGMNMNVKVFFVFFFFKSLC